MRPPKKKTVNVSNELANLKHNEKQNKQLPGLPPNTTISRRPMNHASIASPFAGAHVQKVVYVSRKTPVMSAVKRVKKFLQEIEKRAMQSQGVSGVLGRADGRSAREQEQHLHRKLDDVSEKLRRDAEKVLVKASGRAMEQALRIAEWFRTREDEMSTNVEVRTNSVTVIDDLVEKDQDQLDDELHDENEQVSEDVEEAAEVEEGETTMELMKRLDARPEALFGEREAGSTSQVRDSDTEHADPSAKPPKKKRRKRKRAQYDPEDMPEARLRWVKTVEIAISLQA